MMVSDVKMIAPEFMYKYFIYHFPLIALFTWINIYNFIIHWGFYQYFIIFKFSFESFMSMVSVRQWIFELQFSHWYDSSFFINWICVLLLLYFIANVTNLPASALLYYLELSIRLLKYLLVRILDYVLQKMHCTYLN